MSKLMITWNVQWWYVTLNYDMSKRNYNMSKTNDDTSKRNDDMSKLMISCQKKWYKTQKMMTC